MTRRQQAELSLVNRLDPRTKLVLGCLALTAVFIAQRMGTIIAIAALLLTTLSLFGFHKGLLPALRLILPMAALVFIVGYLFFDLDSAVYMSLRLFDLLAVSFIFFKALDPEELGVALRQLKVPYAFVFILTTAMRFVPLIRQKIGKIMAAQKSRGIDLRPRLKNLPNLTALLIPLIVQSFILSDDLAVAMESRGFARKGRSSRHTCRLAPGDYGWMSVSLMAVICFYLWERGKI